MLNHTVALGFESQTVNKEVGTRLCKTTLCAASPRQHTKLKLASTASAAPPVLGAADASLHHAMDSSNLHQPASIQKHLTAFPKQIFFNAMFKCAPTRPNTRRTYTLAAALTLLVISLACSPNVPACGYFSDRTHHSIVSLAHFGSVRRRSVQQRDTH